MAKTNWTKILKAVGGILLTKFLADQKKKNSSGTGTSSRPKDGKTERSTGRVGPSQATNHQGKPQGQPTASSKSSGRTSTPEAGGQYPGDFSGKVIPQYAPELDGDADPGEIVWTWVPYEDDHAQGKDRPVLLIGSDGDWLLGLMLTSKDKDGSRYGQWLDIGAGPWDSQGRDSEVRLDRIIRIAPESMRREGAIMDRKTFDLVANGVKQAGH